MKSKVVNVIGVMSPNNSFGQLTQRFVLALDKAGYDIHFRNYWLNGEVDPVLKKFEKPLSVNSPYILVHWGQTCMVNEMHDGAIVYTMTEASKITHEFVRILNRASVIMVPTEFNKRVFLSSGVKRPIHVSPMGVDLSIYKPDMHNFPKSTVFLTAGSNLSGKHRKGLDRVITAFMLAFPNEQDVVLWVKTRPDDVIMQTYNPRIQHIKDNLDVPNMVSLYQKAFCFVSGSWGEGWGWHINEAMACGKPVISVRWGGVASYFKGDVHGADLAYTLTPYQDGYGLTGYGAVPSIESMATAMRDAYKNKIQYFLRGLQGYTDVQSLTLKNMQQSFVNIVKRYV